MVCRLFQNSYGKGMDKNRFDAYKNRFDLHNIDWMITKINSIFIKSIQSFKNRLDLLKIGSMLDCI